MTPTDDSPADRFAAALRALGERDADAFPFLGPEECRDWLGRTEALPYRQARPVVGEGERAVRQDFEICDRFDPSSPFWALACRVEAPLNEALARFDPAPVALPFRLNDLVVQRYPAGSLGITPHRDHVRYQGLVANLVLSGVARFSVRRDRSGRGARDVPGPPGHVILMRNAGFAGARDRPFHRLTDVTERRVIVGLRFRSDAA
ncbi:MAG: hypothetical protein EXQ86_06355 [Rhodospirillales bacterium]|nr:hypothetical protein [Rhodospirillales bacterium]